MSMCPLAHQYWTQSAVEMEDVGGYTWLVKAWTCNYKYGLMESILPSSISLA